MAHNMRNVDPSNVETEILTNDEQEELTNLVLEDLEAEEKIYQKKKLL